MIKLSLSSFALVFLLSPLAHAADSRDIAKAANDLLQRRYAADAPGGAVLVARGDKVLYRAARGEADVDKDIALNPSDVFRIGSVTKQFTAAGLLKLVEGGKVKLADPLTKYVPDFPGGEAITILQLLNHTSGVRSYTSIPGYMNEPVQRDLTTAQMIDVFKNEKPPSAPGATWAYNNSGYILVGAVIEAASGKPWHEYLRETFFKPLGMKNTGYALDARLLPLQVKGYTFSAPGKVAPSRPISMTQPHAAGALVSTLDDLLKWNRALHEGKILKTATYTHMITPVGAAAAPEVGYGFGIFKMPVRTSKALHHGGGIFGFMSSLLYVPGADVTVVVLENDDLDNDRIGGESADNFSRRLAALALGDPYPALNAIAIDAETLKKSEGVYRYDGNVIRILRVMDGKLTAQRDGKGPRAVLTPVAKDDFVYADGFNRVTLQRNASGAIIGARHFSNGDGEGVVGVRSDEPLPPLPVYVKLPDAALERLTGTYAMEQRKLKVSRDGDTLLVQMGNQPPMPLGAKSPTEFEVEESGMTFVFAAGDSAASEVTMKQGGREMQFKRTE